MKTLFPESHTYDKILAKIYYVLDTYQIEITKTKLVIVTDNDRKFVKAFDTVSNALPALPCL